MQDTKFWMIWSPQGQLPNKKHASSTLAKEEAARLVDQSPQREFYILEATHCVKLESTPVKVDVLKDPIAGIII